MIAKAEELNTISQGDAIVKNEVMIRNTNLGLRIEMLSINVTIIWSERKWGWRDQKPQCHKDKRRESFKYWAYRECQKLLETHEDKYYQVFLAKKKSLVIMEEVASALW